MAKRWKKPTRRQRMDRWLEQNQLLKHQTEGLSADQVAARYAQAGIKVQDKWFEDTYGKNSGLVGSNPSQIEPIKQHPNRGTGNFVQNFPQDRIVGQSQINLSSGYNNPETTVPNNKTIKNANVVVTTEPKKDPYGYRVAEQVLTDRLNLKPDYFDTYAENKANAGVNGIASVDDVVNGKANWSDIAVDKRKEILSDPTFYKDNKITGYSPAIQQQILADTNFDWKQLPSWQEKYWKIMSNPKIMASPMALAGANAGKILGAPGMAAGAVGGYLLGVTGGQQYDPTKGITEQPSMAAGAMKLLNVLSEGVEQGLGYSGQLLDATVAGLQGNEQAAKAAHDILFDPATRSGAWEAGRLTYEYADMGARQVTNLLQMLSGEAPFALFSDDPHVAQPGQDFVIGAAMPVDKEAVATGRIDPFTGKPAYVTDAMQVLMNARHEIRDEINKGGDADEVTKKYLEKAGIYVAGSLSDLAYQSKFDPLEAMPNMNSKLQVKWLEHANDGLRKIGELTPEQQTRIKVNDIKAEVYRQTPNMTGILAPQGEASRKFRALVQAKLTPDEVKHLSWWERKIAGFTPEGRISELQQRPLGENFGKSVENIPVINKIPKVIEHLVTLQPKAKAKIFLQRWANSVNLLLDWSGNKNVEPRQMVEVLKATADMDMGTLKETGAEFMASPEAYTTIGATKDFLPTLEKKVLEYETAGANRNMFWNIQKILGDNPKQLLKDFVSGDGRATFERLKQKLATLDTPEAKELLANINDGKVTANTLSDMFSVFKDGKIAINNQEFMAHALNAFEDHMRTWGKEYFDLKEEGLWDSSLRLLKGAQSLLLLDLSPSAIVNDFINERVMLATTGILGFNSPAKMDNWIKDFGLAPKDAGYGMVGDTAKAERGVVDEITRGKGKVSKIASGINLVRSKLPRSILSSRFNEYDAKQIYVREGKSFWSKTWREGRGFDKMPASLEIRLKQYGIDPQTVYQNMRSVFRPEQIQNFTERVVNNDINAHIDEAARVVGMNPVDVAEMLTQLEILDTLREGLEKAKTPFEREQVFDSVYETARKKATQIDAQQLTAKLDHFKNKIGVEKQAGALQAAQDIAIDFFEGRIENDTIWAKAWATVAGIEDKRVRNAILSKAAQDASSMWQARQLRQEALYDALFKSINTSDPFYLDFIKLLRQENGVLRKFFEDKNEAVQNLINSSADYETRKALWEAHNKEFNERFDRDHKGVIESQKLRNDLFVAEQGRLFGVEGEAMARSWVDAVMEHTEIIHREIVAFREFLSDDANMPSEFSNRALWHDAAWREYMPKVYQKMWAERLQVDMKGAGELYKWDESPETVQKYVDAKRLTQVPPIADIPETPLVADAIQADVATGVMDVIATRIDQISREGALSNQLAELDNIKNELLSLGQDIQARAGKNVVTRFAELLKQVERERDAILNNMEADEITNRLTEFERENYPEGLDALNEQLNNGSRQEGDMPMYPPGGYDQLSGWLDLGKLVRNGFNEKTVPVLDAMKQSAMSVEKKYTFKDVNLDSQTINDLNDWLRDTHSKMMTHKRATKGWAEAVRDLNLLDYERQYGFDRLLSAGVPYEFFGTRTGMNWMVRVLDRPAWMSRYARLMNVHDKYENNLPERLRNKYFIKIPFLPEWAGGGVYIDPTYQLFPFKSFLQPLEALKRDNQQLNNSATYVIRDWEESGVITTEEAVEALSTRQGINWERAMAQAKVDQGENLNTGGDYLSMLLSPALYATIPYYLVTGKKMTNAGFPSGQLPITKVGQGLETAFNGTPLEWVGDFAGLLAKPEKALRKKLGLHEFGEWGEFYIDRQLANMAAEGVDSKLIQQAMIEKKGKLYEQAEQRVRQELMLKVPGMLPLHGALNGAKLDQIVLSALPSLFPAGLLPSAEMEHKGLKQEYTQAWDRYAATGDKKGTIDKFFDDHPEYQARLALRRDPKERLYQFQKSIIWEQYDKLGATDKKTVAAFLGDDFQLFMDSDPNVEWSTEQLAMWAKVLKGIVPDVPETQSILERDKQGQVPQINFYDKNVTAITDEFFTQRTKYHPNYYQVQQGYFDLPKSKRPAYLLAHPELKEYWDWKKKWETSYPELKPVFDGKVFKRVDTSNFPPMLEDYIADYAYSGTRLPTGAMKALEQQWILAGRPYDDMKVWLDSQIVPAFMYGNGGE